MVASTDNLLNTGLYTPAEAAFYARVQTRLMVRWLFGNKVGDPVLRPQLEPIEAHRFVTFLDFVQTMAVREIRAKYNVPLPKIRDAVQLAQDRYNVSHPLAKENTMYLFGRELVIRLGEDRVVEMSGKHAGQEMITKIVVTYMLDVSFDEDRLAREFTAFRWRDHTVTMNPRLRFGEPMLPSCGYSARALWEACISEGSFEAAAEAYGVTVEDTTVAMRYYDHLQGNVAA